MKLIAPVPVFVLVLTILPVKNKTWTRMEIYMKY